MLDVARRTLIELFDTISGSLQAIKNFKTLKPFYLTQDYTNYLSKTSNVPIRIAYTYKRDFYFKIKYFYQLFKRRNFFIMRIFKL